ncbi:MAG: hypothetical protein CMJ81_08135 [Planctomycetaceae bacterium]|nr:hypothetical protein [Planctomycetaceae bacterium]MBP62327.1 hypothetical protein [Planctomycetaceae bacterium]
MYALGKLFGFGKTDEYVDYYVYHMDCGVTRQAIVRICKTATRRDGQKQTRQEKGRGENGLGRVKRTYRITW